MRDSLSVENGIILGGLLAFAVCLAIWYYGGNKDGVTALVGGLSALGGAWVGGRAAFNAEAGDFEKILLLAHQSNIGAMQSGDHG